MTKGLGQVSQEVTAEESLRGEIGILERSEGTGRCQPGARGTGGPVHGVGAPGGVSQAAGRGLSTPDRGEAPQGIRQGSDWTGFAC